MKKIISALLLICSLSSFSDEPQITSIIVGSWEIESEEFRLDQSGGAKNIEQKWTRSDFKELPVFDGVKSCNDLAANDNAQMQIVGKDAATLKTTLYCMIKENLEISCVGILNYKTDTHELSCKQIMNYQATKKEFDEDKNFQIIDNNNLITR